MEMPVALLLSDLSGYTALTETHGAATAADLIDKYHELVTACLSGDCRLQEQVGDEVMVVSHSAADLLTTALLLRRHLMLEERFLQVHAGMHFGNVLIRKGRLFGSAVNLTSRIMSVAPPGAFWCSGAFREALPGPSQARLLPRGVHQFKNVAEPVSLFELEGGPQQADYIDPICRMVIKDTGTAVPHPETADLYFCSPECLDIYVKGNTGTAMPG